MAESRLGLGTHVSSCGHSLHAVCWVQYWDKECERSQGALLTPCPVSAQTAWRAGRRGFRSGADRVSGEFTCPLCKRLSNAVLPLLPPIKHLAAAVAEPKVRRLTSRPCLSSREWLLQEPAAGSSVKMEVDPVTAQLDAADFDEWLTFVQGKVLKVRA